MSRSRKHRRWERRVADIIHDVAGVIFSDKPSHRDFRRADAGMFTPMDLLGNVAPDQRRAHERAGRLSHDWTRGKSSTVTTKSARRVEVEQTCRICKKRRTRRSK